MGQTQQWNFVRSLDTRSLPLRDPRPDPRPFRRCVPPTSRKLSGIVSGRRVRAAALGGSVRGSPILTSVAPAGHCERSWTSIVRLLTVYEFFLIFGEPTLIKDCRRPPSRALLKLVVLNKFTPRRVRGRSGRYLSRSTRWGQTTLVS